MDNPYRNLPSVDRLMGEDRLVELCRTFSREAVVGLVRDELERVRQGIASGQPSPDLSQIVDRIAGQADSLWQPSLKLVINATGVILHTNLGRAPLSSEAIAAMKLAAAGYSNLEFDLDSGERGSRYRHGEQLLCQLTGAEAAMMVNNNASAVLLALTALAQGQEVIISRGQAVEIGGGFRIPDVMRQSGATLVDVGTTNRTYVRDYEQAINFNTSVILRVHTSNFRVVGFVHEVVLAELVDLAKKHQIEVLDDLGSGCLVDTRPFGLIGEPLVQDSVKAGAGLTCFSGDKLLGGPQAGLIVGRKDLIDRLKRHPLARAVRMDKVTIAGLMATLLHYLRGEALTAVPVWRMIAMPLAEVETRARLWAQQIGTEAVVMEGRSAIGGGSLPAETLPTALVSIAPASREPGPVDVEDLGRLLRLGTPAVVGRIEKDRFILDPRTVLPDQDEALLEALQRVLSKGS